MVDRPRPAEPSAEIVALKGNVKASREDWLAVALDVLISQGVDSVKILDLSERLQVSRSSFYWYFKSRQGLFDALLDVWGETNTRSVVEACDAPADTITGAVCNLFRCFMDPDLFDPQLDFAIRDWARRSGAVRRVVDEADATRLAAVAALFARHGYGPDDAAARARILYYMQVGYYALELREPLDQRLDRAPAYLAGFTGVEPRPEEIDALAAHARAARARAKRPRAFAKPED